MVSTTECLEFNCLFNYKQLKLCKKEWLYSPLFYSSNKNTTWRLQIDRSQPSLIIFNNKCTEQRIFPSNDFSWGFENFCTYRELKDERHLLRDPKTKLINVRCTMNLEIFTPDNITDDRRLATDLFHKYSLEQWIAFLKQRDNLPELSNRVNQEIEARLKY